VKPDHLAPAPTEPRVWMQRRAAALAALALGSLTFIVVAVSNHPIFSAPDARLSIPGFAATVIAAIFSLTRREHAYPFWLAGLGLATAALVLGWVMVLAIVVSATAVVIAILHVVM
jgi:hypothetical protein